MKEIPSNYQELSREYLLTRKLVKNLALRVKLYHHWSDEQALKEARAWSRRLAVARNKHPDREQQLRLF